MTQPHPPRRSAEEQARLEAAFTDLFERRICFNEVLGLRIESIAPDDFAMRLTMRPDLVGHYLYGRLHGGVISATLDATGGNAIMAAIGEKHAHETTEQIMHRFAKIGTIDLRIDYLRPGLGEWFIARARLTRLGGRVASVQMELHNNHGDLIATGAAAYIVS
ncbi:MAG: hypothetical protein RJA44_1046 [Pseudomonadota bacterium]|jgi:uncharacterized protein (TIGR00369 family)